MDANEGPFASIRFSSRTEFQSHILAALQSGQREIWMADAKFLEWSMNSLQTEEALHKFLLASRANRIRLLAFDTEYLATQAPRFIKLLRLFAQSIECRQIVENLASRFAEEVSLIIVDRARIVRRFHSTTMRGVAEFDPNEVGPWVERFQGMWDESTAVLSGTTLGLGG